VTGSPGGIVCGPTCTASLAPGTAVTLTATPGAGDILVGSSVTGCGTALLCTFIVQNATIVTATFEPFLSIAVNQSQFGTGETIIVSEGVTNPGLDATVDFYLGVVLPDGNTVIFFTSVGGATGIGSLSDVTTLRPLAAAVALATPFTVSRPTFATHTWTGTEPPGTYYLFFAAVVAGSLADGSVDFGDILALKVVSFTFAP
jgi:hypothetical protein